MNYYYDFEFLEGTQSKTFIGIKYGKTLPTIQPISVGIISDDGREYYAISKDFNLKEAWNRYDEKVEIMSGDMRNRYPEGKKTKVYWIRENVLRPIFDSFYPPLHANLHHCPDFNYRNMKLVIKYSGKSNKQIAEELFQFCTNDSLTIAKAKYYNVQHQDINLYGYYSAYDHVALCWLFGKMIDLPNGFPMYTIDLKQMLDEKANGITQMELTKTIVSGTNFEAVAPLPKELISIDNFSLKAKLEIIKKQDGYPKETNAHNALADAKWNKQLHEFLKSI